MMWGVCPLFSVCVDTLTSVPSSTSSCDVVQHSCRSHICKLCDGQKSILYFVLFNTVNFLFLSFLFNISHLFPKWVSEVTLLKRNLRVSSRDGPVSLLHTGSGFGIFFYELTGDISFSSFFSSSVKGVDNTVMSHIYCTVCMWVTLLCQFSLTSTMWVSSTIIQLKHGFKMIQVFSKARPIRFAK